MHIVGCTRWWHAHCPCTSSMHTMMSWHCVVSVIVQLLLSCETRWRWCNTCYGHTHMHRCWGRGATISKIHGLLGHGCEQYLHGIISIPHACLTFLWYMYMLEYPIFMDAPFRVSPLPFACRPCLAPWGDDYKGDPSEQMINRISMVYYAQDMIIHIIIHTRDTKPFVFSSIGSDPSSRFVYLRSENNEFRQSAHFQSDSES